jgi:parallel beta-helix repeat protein
MVSQLGAVSLLVAALGALPAHAAGVTCGDVLTANTVLSQDLICSSGDGLIIGASGITLDLKGHTLTGAAGSVAGIRIANGFSGVTVQNGRVAGFTQGVVASYNNDKCHLTKLQVRAQIQGILLANATNTLVDKNTVTAQYQDAIKVDGSDNTVTQNTVLDSPFGISVSNSSAGNVVSRNVLAGNRDFAVAVFDGATGTLIAQNQASGSLNGIVVTGNAAGTSVSQNSVSGATQDGIHVAADSSATQVIQNTAFNNGGNGIGVYSPDHDTTITKNTAYSNGGAGIFAVDGVTDGGGNIAYDNGAPCAVVTCSTS